MSVTEALGEGVMVTVVGLIIVFSVLIILMLVMMAMKKYSIKSRKRQKQRLTRFRKLFPCRNNHRKNSRRRTQFDCGSGGGRCGKLKHICI